MKRNTLIITCLLLLGATALFFTSRTKAQSSNAESRITQAIDEHQLIRLTGNTHPSARPQFDQGAAPPDLPMNNMMLVLKRSPQQLTAASNLLAQQQDRSSPNYHKWLTPTEFGQQFGASDSDIQTITSWLQSHGFTIDQVPPSRSMIQFSGSASNVQDAFHTEIHKYFVKGEEHWANSSDPMIPAALAPVVAGPNSLHSFHHKAMNRRLGTFARNKITGKVRPLQSQFTIGNTCGLLENSDCFLLGPGDFTKIYDAPTASTGGSGITIGIVGDSEINIADTHNFYSLFGVTRNDPTQITPPNATNPGVQTCNPPVNGDECEADIDTQWSGSVAPGAAVELVAAANTNAQNGIDVAAEYIVNQGGTAFQVLSVSFGNCEALLGSTENQLYGGNNGDSGLWMQAAMEGITVVVSSGDQGSAACESPFNDGEDTPAQPATTGLAVNGLASTWDNVAVGGTDFNQFSNAGTFWNTSNTAGTQVSAKSYIPETTWNDSCSNTLFTNPQLGFLSSPQANCNILDPNFLPSFVVPVGGGGGASSCAVFVGNSCSGYPKPLYQTGTGVPADNARDLPDISLFAGTGIVASFYAVCDQDLNPENPPKACNIGSVNDIQGFGGTSVSTAAFAGIVALIDHAKGGPLGPAGRTGRINDRLYTLAATKSCTSAAPAAPATNPPSGCDFNDIVMGTIAQPCVLGTPATAPSQCSGTSEAIALPPTRILSNPTTIFVVLACVSFIGTLILGFRLKERNWSTAFAVLTFALFMTCAACGSGGTSTTTNPNPVDGILTGYSAGAGYDQATGLGSVNVTNLTNDW